MLGLKLVALVATQLAACAALAVPAAAQDKPTPVTCTDLGPCVVSVSAPGQPGPTGGPPEIQPVSSGGSSAQCVYPRGSDNQVPCSDPNLGWLNTYNGCWYRSLPAPSPGSVVAAEGGGYHPLGDGNYYMQSCNGIVGPRPGAVGLLQLIVWQQAPPAGYGGARPDPALLAQQAEAKLGLSGPSIRLSPPDASQQVVGLPTWMWTTVSDATWTPHTATAAVTGASVTATATATSIDWSMGDGSTVRCDGPGTPYSSMYGAHSSSPTCGYTYSTPSSTAADGTFPVTGTTTWKVTWAGGGQNGTLTIRRSSTVGVVVDEAQAVNS